MKAKQSIARSAIRMSCCGVLRIISMAVVPGAFGLPPYGLPGTPTGFSPRR
jgi:hypothetical protein